MFVIILTIFSSCPGGSLRKTHSGAYKTHTTPIMVISQGKPMVAAMGPPIDGPVQHKDRSFKHSIVNTCIPKKKKYLK